MTAALSKWPLATCAASLQKIAGMAATMNKELDTLHQNAPAHVLARLNSEKAFEFDGIDLKTKCERLMKELADG